MDAWYEFIGYMAGIFVTIAFIPQAMKAYATKDVSSLSLTSFLILILGIIGWVIYGAYMQSYELVIFNLISLFFDVIILLTIIRYKK